MKKIKLSGVVGWDFFASDLIAELPTDGSDVYLIVDSVGGSVFEGNRLYNAIKDYPGKITVELGAVAASAASYFPLAAGAENIKVRENTVYMIHKAWAFAIGNADDMKKQAEILDGFDKIMARIYSEITGETLKKTLAKMGEELWIFGGQEVIDAGFASGFAECDDTGRKEKSEIIAEIEEAKATLKEVQRKEDLNKWAAQLNVSASKIETAPGNPGGNKEKEVKTMNLDEILAKNPEVAGEIQAKTGQAVAEDRERVGKILAASGMALNESVLNAVKDGVSAGDYALAELTSARASAGNVSDFGKIEPKAQKPEEPAEVKEVSNKVDLALDAFYGKGEK